MTVNVTLSQGNQSIDIPLIAQGGENLITRTVGKPELAFRNGGELQPRFQDQYSGIQGLEIVGQFYESDAYAQATKLADFIKSAYQSPISFDVPLGEYDTPFDVTPAIGADSALTLTYQPGRRDWVIVELSLSQVDSVRSSTSQGASTPTTTGNGPIQLKDAKDVRSVDIETGVVVERSVGRPNDSENRKPNAVSPIYVYKRGDATDTFEIGFQNVSDPVDATNRLYDLFSNPLGSTGLRLDFGGLYGLGEFSVVPSGSGALRHIRAAGEQGVIQYPVLSLRRVRN